MAIIQKLLDFAKPFDVNYFDTMVDSFFRGKATKEVHEALATFQQHPESWRRAPDILQRSQLVNSKMIALNILGKTIQCRWKVLPDTEKAGMKNFVEKMIISLSSDGKMVKEQGPFLTKVNSVLIEILKHEWPRNWPNFISDLVNGSKNSEHLCTNNMKILRQLSEEVFGGISELTSEKESNLKSSLNKEFQCVFELCMFVLEKSTNSLLLTETLNTLSKFLIWIPVGYVFETRLIETLSLKFYPAANFQVKALICLTEIGAIHQFADTSKIPAYKKKLVQMFIAVMERTLKFVNPTSNVVQLIASGGQNAATYIQHLANFITSCGRYHFAALEGSDNNSRQALLAALGILLKISLVDNVELFKITLDFWHHMVTELQKSIPQDVVLLGAFMNQQQRQTDPRFAIYRDLLNELRMVLVGKMVRPKEVLITEDENGNVVKEELKDSVTVNLYKIMKDTLCCLTKLDPNTTRDQMKQKLDKQMDNSEWSWHNLCTLCWSVGSMSGSMSEDMEKQFLVHVIKVLLNLCEKKRGKENKAVVASNIMYVVRKYPRFLKKHWKFLKTVVNKLFEFMHESFPGVQDMSVETFLEISQQCQMKFIKIQEQDTKPFINEVLNGMEETTKDLSHEQRRVFFEAMGETIKAETNPEARQKLVFQLMSSPNQKWIQIVTAATQNPVALQSDAAADTIKGILHLNYDAAKSIGEGYIVQFGRIYTELLQIYKFYSQLVSNAINKKGAMARRHTDVKCMCTVKTESLRLITCFIENANQADYPTIFKEFVPKLLETVLADYKQNNPVARDADVLSVCTTLVDKIGEPMLPAIPQIFDSVLWTTLQMIQRDMENFPDHRLKFFQLLRAVNSKCFQVFFKLNQEQFKVVMNAISWSFKHLEKNVSETGLQILYELLQNVENSDAANEFYKNYLMHMLNDVFGVLTDTLHKSGFKMQAMILAKIFFIVDSGNITCPLWGQGQNYNNNQSYLREAVCKLIAGAFKHLQPEVIKNFTLGLFQLSTDINKFNVHLRDFLVQTKEFQVTDNSALLGQTTTQ